MSPAELLDELRRRGVELWREGDRLRYRAPRGVLTPELKEDVTTWRDELFDLLAEPSSLAEEPPAAGETARLRPDPSGRFEPFPLTEIQQAYWLGRDGGFELGGVAAHVYVELERRGLDPARFRDALRRLVARHDALRTELLADGRQRIRPGLSARMAPVVDLGRLPAAAAAVSAARLRRTMSHQVLPTTSAPLFDIRLVLCPGGTVRTLFSLDLLILDAASIRLFFQELALLYRDPGAALPAVDASFRDYVLAERRRHETPRYRRARDYWHSRLAKLPPGPELQLARRPSDVGIPRFVRRTARLAPELWQRLQSRAREAGLTPSGILMAAFAEVLATWSRNRRFTLNLTFFNRLPLHPHVERILGDFTSTLLLAIDAAPGGPFVERAQAIQEQTWRDLEHSSFSGIEVLRELARGRHGGPGPRMPVVFTSLLGQTTKADWDIARETLGEVRFGISQTPQVWLDHQVYEERGALVWNWDTVDRLFPAGLLDAMFEAYGRLLDRLLDRPATWSETSPCRVPEAQLAERAAVNATAVDATEETIVRLVVSQARRQPRATAVVTARRRLSFGELVARAAGLGDRLARHGVRRGALVAVVMEKGWEQAVATLGTLFAGAAYLPVDPALPPARIDDLLDRSAAAAVVTTPEVEARHAWPPDLPRLVPHEDDAVEDATEPGAGPLPSPDDLAYVIYTSGSTGRPKGVAVSHRGAVNTLLDIRRRFAIAATDRVLGLSALAFDLSVWDFFGVWAAGGAVVLPEPAAARDPRRWLELMAAEGVTVWNSVPALIEMLLESLGDGETLPPFLRLVLLSGDWIPLDLPERIRARRPGVAIVSLGGATEASIWSICFPVREVSAAWRSVPYGRPLARQHFEALAPGLTPAPVWVPGELHIGGLGLAWGYWREAALTAERFVPDPSATEPGARLYRTGDLGRYLPGGTIEFLGRQDHQVKIRGHRIELGEVEAALVEHPEVDAAVVMAVGPERRRQQLAAWVVARATRPRSSPDDPAPWDTLVAAGHAEAERSLRVDPELGRLLPRLEELSTAYVSDALAELGAFTDPRETASSAEIAERLGIEPRYHRWLRRSLDMLAREGRLTRRGDGYGTDRPLPGGLARRTWDELSRGVGPEILEGVRHGLDFLRAHGENLAAVLTGRLHALEIFFADGETSRAEELYREGFEDCNAIVGTVAGTVAAAWAAHRRGSGPLRVLEIGAGVGSSTAFVLPVLPADETVYDYTDISPHFFETGRRTFGDRPWIRFHRLDIERDPGEQGFEPESYDLVVAASVLHATRRVDETLRHVRRLLAPGAFLLMVEETRFLHLTQVTMALQPGFERFEDTDLRPEHGLLTPEAWHRELGRHGFDRSVDFHRPESLADLQGFRVVLAQAGARPARLEAADLASFLRRRLPDYMVPATFRELAALPLTANGKVDRKALPAPRETAAAGTRTPDTSEPARGETERRLAELWGEVLGTRPAGRYEDFFELGGDSLLAVRLLERIRREMEVEVALVTFFAAPTPAELGRRIEADLPTRQRCPASWPNGVVPISSTGPPRSLFLAPPAGGSPACYVELATRLDTEVRILGLRSRGLTDAARPLKRLEEIAADFLDDLRAVQPEGPYRIGGWSFGATVAYEMARQLRSRGCEVELVALLDGGVPDPRRPMRLGNPVTLLRVLGEFLRLTRQVPLPRSYRELRELARWAGLGLPRSWGGLWRRRPVSGLRFLARLGRDLWRTSRVYCDNVVAAVRYRPAPYQGEVVLFRTAAQRGTLHREMLPVLDRLTDAVRIYDVTGNHMSLLLTPSSIDSLASRLRQCLAELPPSRDAASPARLTPPASTS